MITQPIQGASYLLRGFSLMWQPGVRAFVAIPLAINVVLFGLMALWAKSEFAALVRRYVPDLPDWLGWVESLLWVLFALTLAIVVLFGFSILANFIAAPFNGPLSAAAERKLTGRNPPEGGTLIEALKGVLPALIDQLRKLLYFALLAIPLLLLTLVPGVNLLTPFLWPLLGAWMLALEYNDYPMGNHGIDFRAQREQVRKERWRNLGFGAATLAATLIPLVNFLVMPAAVCGATAMWVARRGQG